MSVAAVARIIGAQHSTAYRPLITLIEVGYVERDARTRGYRLGHN